MTEIPKKHAAKAQEVEELAVQTDGYAYSFVELAGGKLGVLFCREPGDDAELHEFENREDHVGWHPVLDIASRGE